MTRIYAERGTNNGRCYLSVKGHATGSSQVCAAVSGLVYALAGYLMNATGVDVRGESLESADAVIDFFGDQMAVGAFLCTVIGLRQIAKEYGDFVEMEYVEGKT